jgi:hypothetical protein
LESSSFRRVHPILHVLQIMDMLFGMFKTLYFQNLEIVNRQNLEGIGLRLQGMILVYWFMEVRGVSWTQAFLCFETQRKKPLQC